MKKWKRQGDSLWCRWLGVTLEVFTSGRWRLSWLSATGDGGERKGQCRSVGDAKIEVTKEAVTVAGQEVELLRSFLRDVVDRPHLQPVVGMRALDGDTHDAFPEVAR